MIKNILASEIKNISKIIGLCSLTIVLIVLLVYGELTPKTYIDNIIILRVAFTVTPIVSVIIYIVLLRFYRYTGTLENKYLKQRKVSWNYKVIIIFVTYTLVEVIKLYVRKGKSENQKVLDQADNDFIKTLIGSGFQAPIIEEIVFRGLLFLVIMTATSYLFNKRTKKHDILGLTIFVILSALIFGLVHVISYDDYAHIMTYIVSGAAYAFVFVITRDIKVSIILHMLNNIPITLIKYHYDVVTGTMFLIFTVFFFIAVYRFVKNGELSRLIKFMEERWGF